VLFFASARRNFVKGGKERLQEMAPEINIL